MVTELPHPAPFSFYLHIQWSTVGWRWQSVSWSNSCKQIECFQPGGPSISHLGLTVSYSHLKQDAISWDSKWTLSLSTPSGLPQQSRKGSCLGISLQLWFRQLPLLEATSSIRLLPTLFSTWVKCPWTNSLVSPSFPLCWFLQSKLVTERFHNSRHKDHHRETKIRRTHNNSKC